VGVDVDVINKKMMKQTSRSPGYDKSRSSIKKQAKESTSSLESMDNIHAEQQVKKHESQLSGLKHQLSCKDRESAAMCSVIRKTRQLLHKQSIEISNLISILCNI
jgi:hypothetical protein